MKYCRDLRRLRRDLRRLEQLVGELATWSAKLEALVGRLERNLGGRLSRLEDWASRQGRHPYNKPWPP